MVEFITADDNIIGVQIVNVMQFSDDRGIFCEAFRREWFPQVSWDRLQSNQSKSRANVLRGLHYHFHQVDYWFVPHGHIRAALLDLRPKSPTYRQTQTLDMGGDYNVGLFIPVGVAHGFYALTDCTLMYYVNNYYDNSDEFGVAWDDPQIAIDWGNQQAPIVSARDTQNPRIADIPAQAMPEPFQS